MHQRYFLTSTRFVAGNLETSTFAFGRFASHEEAEGAALMEYGAYGCRVTDVRPETKLDAVIYKVSRIIVRTLRMALGIVIALIAYTFLWDSGPNLGGVPLGQLTLDMLIGALFRGALLVAAGWLAWHSAFGDGPDARYR